MHLREASRRPIWGRQAESVAIPIHAAMHGCSRGLYGGVDSLSPLRAGVGQPGSPEHLLQGCPRVLRQLVQLRVRPLCLQGQTPFIEAVPSYTSSSQTYHTSMPTSCRVPYHMPFIPALAYLGTHTLHLARRCPAPEASLEVDSPALTNAWTREPTIPSRSRMGTGSQLGQLPRRPRHRQAG